MVSFFGESSRPISIEEGYFVLTMHPSLHCGLSCPHCYLSEEIRRSRRLLSVKELEIAARKIDAYYQAKNLPKKEIVTYWYGGEPTDLGLEYFSDALDVLDGVFAKDKGYEVRHLVMSSLVTMKNDSLWFDLWKSRCGAMVQTSYDGDLRGRGAYVRQWEKKVRAAQEAGLEVSTLSVVNNEFIGHGPAAVYDYLAELGVTAVDFLRLLRSENNVASGAYAATAPSMKLHTDFLIGIGERYLERKRAGLSAPEFGGLRRVWETQTMFRPGANTAGQTMFLMPNGEFALLDYEGKLADESFVYFGSILEKTFEEVLHSPARRAFIRKQRTRNGNPECLDCDRKNSCLMEFWKENPEGDECYGAKRFVDWVDQQSFQGLKWKQAIFA